MKVGIILLVILVVIVIWAIASYNSFITLKTRVLEGLSTIDVFLKKRYDLIPNLIETVKGYSIHEKSTLSEVIEARNKALSSGKLDKAANEGELTKSLSKLFMLAEAYPELKADTQFLNLQEELSNIESEIEKSRRYYNGLVRDLNISIQKFPGSLIAAIFHFEKEEFFEITTSVEKENIKVNFN